MPQGQLSPQSRENSRQGVVNYWAKMTPEQRSAEVKRRQKLAFEKKLELASKPKAKRIISKEGMERVREAQRKRWRIAKLQARGSQRTYSTKSPFPPEVEVESAVESAAERMTLYQRVRALESEVSALRSKIGL